MLRKTCVKIRSPPGVKATSTGLSMPPVITGSMPRAIGPAAEDVGRAGDERRLARPLVGLLGERPFAPVDPAVGAEIGPVQVVGAAGQRLALEPLDALVGDAVAIGVGQFPDARRRGDIERAVVATSLPRGTSSCRRRWSGVSNVPSPSGLRAGRSGAASFGELFLDRCRWSPTNRRRKAGPRSSNAAAIGRSTSGGPATGSIVNPSGTRKVRSPSLNSPPPAGATSPVRPAATMARKILDKLHLSI